MFYYWAIKDENHEYGPVLHKLKLFLIFSNMTKLTIKLYKIYNDKYFQKQSMT